MNFRACSRSVILGLSFFLSTLAFGASPNLTGRMVSAKVHEESDGTKRIVFEIEIRNRGDAAASGNLRVKPFLVSRTDAAVVLPNLNASVSIEPGESARLNYREPLPVTPSQEWWIGAVVNPDWEILEEGPRYKYDNTPDLFPIGEFEVLHAAPVAADRYDLYPRVVDGNFASWGSVSHDLRAIVRGTGSIDFPSSALRSLFGVINFETRQVTLLDYNRNSDPEDPEKAWYAISWYDEKDGAGADLQVDYYSNNILFGHVAPGSYRFFTLLNSRDLVPENNIFDNLETLPLELSLVSFPDRGAVYVGGRAGEAKSTRILLGGMYPGSAAYTAKLVSATAELNLDLAPGSVSDEGTLSLDLPALPTGEYTAELKIMATLDAYAQTVVLPVRYSVFGETLPALEKSTTQIDLLAHQGRDSAPGEIVLRNIGTAPLDFHLKTDKTWISATPLAGRIAPGASQTITVRGLAVANLGQDAASYVEGRVLVQATTLEDQTSDSVRITLQTQNQ